MSDLGRINPSDPGCLILLSLPGANRMLTKTEVLTESCQCNESVLFGKDPRIYNLLG